MSVLLLAESLLESDVLTIGGEAVRIVGIVVVVQRTVRIDMAHIVGVPRVRSTQPPIRRRTLAGK